MRISNAKLFVNGAFLDGGIEFDSKITAVGAHISGGIDAGGCYVIPGLVDIHTHGARGADCSDGSGETLTALSRHYAAQGVTSWCPTTMTLGEDALLRVMAAVRSFVRPEGGAKLAGVHLEGPFLSRAKRGAQASEHLRTPDLDLFRRLNEASGNRVKLVTVAPELPGAMEFIQQISPCCRVSLGHTAADYDTAMAAYAAGASHTTHLFNGMSPLHHRAPGVVAAAWDSGATVELIADGHHIHPATVRLAHRLFGARLALVSDSLPCTGMPDGEYTLGGQSISLTQGNATCTGTDTLAGSSIFLLEMLRRSIHFGIPPEAAITAATLTPARIIGMEDEIGSLAAGKWADFVVLNKNFLPEAVYINGICLF